jgi:hypothetical protein
MNMGNELKRSNPFLERYWVDHEDCQSFNKLAHTLRKLGVVEMMFMDADVERYYPEVEDEDGWDNDWGYEDHVEVGVVVKANDKYEVYDIYSGWI